MSADTVPIPQLDTRYSQQGATPSSWADVRDLLRHAPTSWLSTVRPDGRPHVTPLLTVWEQESPWFCTGPQERKAANLAANPQCVLTTGDNRLDAGLDVVVEGTAVRVPDDATLRRVAATYEAKYGPDWHFDVSGGMFVGPVGNQAIVFRVDGTTVFAFRKGEYSQTRFRTA